MIAKKIALAFGIALVLPMMLHYGVSTFVPKPKWEDYAFLGDSSAAKRQERRAAEKRFEQHLFAVAVPIGLVALAVGVFLRLPALGTGLMFGGIFSICDGYFNYWSELADVLKFVSLLVAFLLLVFLGYRRIERKEI
jgi:uncharacterized membrane protein